MIIQSASRSKHLEKYAKQQTMLLAKMAQKSGVSDEEINKILNIDWKNKMRIKAELKAENIKKQQDINRP